MRHRPLPFYADTVYTCPDFEDPFITSHPSLPPLHAGLLGHRAPFSALSLLPGVNSGRLARHRFGEIFPFIPPTHPRLPPLEGINLASAAVISQSQRLPLQGHSDAVTGNTQQTSNPANPRQRPPSLWGFSPLPRLPLSGRGFTADHPWGLPALRTPPPVPELNNDHFLEAIVNGGFTSPSVPSGTPRSLRPPQVDLSSPTLESSDHSPQSTPHDRRSAESARTEPELSLQEFLAQSQASPFITMPTTKKRRASHAASPEVAGPATKRQRASRTQQRPKISPKRPVSSSGAQSFDDCFGSDDEKDVVDLVDIDERVDEPEEEVDDNPKVDNSIKLSGFQCVICMDDVRNLTVTHCGTFRLDKNACRRRL
jgi:hypothetical protein